MTECAPIMRNSGESVIAVRWSGDAATWDRLVAADTESTPCHLAAWREVMTGVLGHDCHYAIAQDVSGDVCGVLPLVRVRSLIFGDYLVSLPFLNSGGPLGSPAAKAALLAYAADLARRQGVDLLELRTRRVTPSSLTVRERKITVRLDLPDSTEALWRAFPAKLRSQIRRPQADGFDARFGPDQVHAFYDVFARNMRSLGTPVLPRAFFESLAAVLPGSVDVGAVYRGAEPVAAGCGFVWRDEFEITWAASRREYSRSAPNMLLYWSFMERMIERRVRVFDFGRCTPGSGTHRFKTQWGGVDLPLPWLQWSPRNIPATPSPERPVYRMATAIWRRLPLTLTRVIGPSVARLLP